MFTNRTTYSQRKLRELSRHNFRFRMIPYILKVELGFLLVAVFGFFVFDFLMFVSLTIMVIMPAAIMLAVRFKEGRMNKNNPSLQKEPTLLYEFHDDHFKIINLDQELDKGNVLYEDIHMAVEGGFNFYLYPNPAMAYIVDKEAFEGIEVEGFRSFLEARIAKTKFFKKR
ncbi:MAG: YcxB family protein [Acholeplasmataceae bacterium]